MSDRFIGYPKDVEMLSSAQKGTPRNYRRSAPIER